MIQSPANAGTLAATGKLDVDAQGDAGFDIRYDPDSGAATNPGHGIATINVDATYRLYDIERLTGKATLTGDFPQGNQVLDLTTGFRPQRSLLELLMRSRQRAARRPAISVTGGRARVRSPSVPPREQRRAGGTRAGRASPGTP